MQLLDEISPGLDLGLNLNENQFKLQYNDFKLSRQFKSFGCFNDVGTGKTVISLLYLAQNYVEKVKTLVVVPSSLLTQYSNSVNVVTGLDWSVETLSSSGACRVKQIQSWRATPDVVILTPRSLIDSIGDLRRKGFKSIIVDEAHMLLGLTNNIRTVVVGLIKFYEYTALLMTATPHNAELESAYGMISILNPESYDNFETFAKEHIEYRRISIGGIERKLIEGYHHIDSLKMHLFSRACRRRSSEVLSLDRPTLIEHKVTLSKQHSKNITSLIREWLDRFDENPEWLENAQQVRQQALMRVTNPPVRDPRYSEPLDNLKTLVESINPGDNKVIIFCHYQRTIKYLASVFEHLKPALVYGGSDSAKESEKFKNDPYCRMVIANYQAGGSGHNWQHAAHTIFYEPISDIKLINQAIGRTHRGGQTKPVVVYFMVYNVEIMKKISTKSFVRAELSRELLGDQTSILDYFKSYLKESVDRDVEVVDT